MNYFEIYLNEDDASIYIRRFGTKQQLIDYINCDFEAGDATIPEFATDTDIQDGWDSDNTTIYRRILIEGKIIVPREKTIIKEIEL